jgi:hypothetical protein
MSLDRESIYDKVFGEVEAGREPPAWGLTGQACRLRHQLLIGAPANVASAARPAPRRTAGAQIGSGCARTPGEVGSETSSATRISGTDDAPALPAPARLCRWWADSQWPASPFTPVVNPGLAHVALQAFFQRRGLDEIGRGETLGEGAVDTA